MVKFDEVPSSISKLNGRVLTLEEANKKYNSILSKIQVKATDNNSRIKKIKDFLENIETIEENLKVLQGEIQQYKYEYENDRKSCTRTDFMFTNSNLTHINNKFQLPHTDAQGNVRMKPPGKITMVQKCRHSFSFWPTRT